MKASIIQSFWPFLVLVLGIGGCTFGATNNQAPPFPTEMPQTMQSALDLGATRTRLTDGMILVYVPGGEFLMGSVDADGEAVGTRIYENEYPQHEVTVEAFWLDQTEVTNAQYALYVQDGHCSAPKDFSSRTRGAYYDDPAFANYPVINVTWYQAVAYCTRAGARLPKEAEWAFAARGPDSLYYPWGDEFDGTLANYCDVNCDMPHPDPSTDDGYADTSPVGNYPEGTSWVGALDLLGNVWEWNWDWHALYEGHEWLQHPNSDAVETYRVLRGGSWDTARGHARNAFRNWYLPDKYENSIGFRCASDIELDP